MVHTNTGVLRFLAALTWHLGFIVLLLKATSLLLQAHQIRPDDLWSLWAVLLGIVAGIIKGIVFFSSSCQKNLRRINSLKNPKVWQFYRPGFFLLLAAMVAFGTTLSTAAAGNFVMLLSVAIVDLSVGMALLYSSHVFWLRRQ